MQLTKAQAEIAVDMHRFRVLCCGRRFGKTTLAIDQIKARASIPNSRIAYIAPTYQQARDIAWAQLKNDCLQAAESINESRLEIKLVNGSIIVLRGWESIETLRGQWFDLIVIDEVASMRNFVEMWQEVIRPTLTDTKGEAIFISTPKGFNHFYDLFNEQDKNPDYKSFHFTSYDNTHVPASEIDAARREIGEDRFAQEYLADFRKTEGLVYKEFERARHVITEDWLNQRKWDGLVLHNLLVGIDFGYAAPCAVLSVWTDNAGNFYVLDEFYERKKTDAEVADYVAALRPTKCFPDPESPGAIEELRRRGVNIRDVIKGKDSIKNGIDSVRETLRAGKLFIHSRCKNTILEFETYVYPDKKPERNESEVPMDENNHALDALRYVVHMSAGMSTRAQQFYPMRQGHDNLTLIKSSDRSRVRYPSALRRR